MIRIVSVEECSSLTQNLMHVCYFAHSVILNAMTTQSTCSLNGIYRPHLLVSTVKSLFTHAHSSPLSLAARLLWCLRTILVILIMARLFPDRLYICTHIYFSNLLCLIPWIRLQGYSKDQNKALALLGFTLWWRKTDNKYINNYLLIVISSLKNKNNSKTLFSPLLF